MKEYCYDDLFEGMEASFERVVLREDFLSFSKLTGDSNPLHMDEDYASTSFFGKKVGFGLLATSFFSTLAGMYLPGKYSLILSVETKMKKPFFEGDFLKVVGKIQKKIDAGRIIILETNIFNDSNEVIQEGKMFIQVLK